MANPAVEQNAEKRLWMKYCDCAVNIYKKWSKMFLF